MTCPNARDATKYSWNFNASIDNGVLHRQHGSPGQPGYMTLDGTLHNGGGAVLTARGLTGDAGYRVGRVADLSPYVYHVDAMVGATSGHGTRTEIRPCTFTFTRS